MLGIFWHFLGTQKCLAFLWHFWWIFVNPRPWTPPPPCHWHMPGILHLPSEGCRRTGICLAYFPPQTAPFWRNIYARHMPISRTHPRGGVTPAMAYAWHFCRRLGGHSCAQICLAYAEMVPIPPVDASGEIWHILGICLAYAQYEPFLSHFRC